MPCAPKHSRWPGNTDLPTTHSHTHSHKEKRGSTKRHTLIVITGRSWAVKKGSTFLRMFQICCSAEGEFNFSCPLSRYTRYEFSCTLKWGYQRQESTLRETMTMRQTQEAATETKGLTDVFGISPTANCSRQREVALEVWCGMIAHKPLIKYFRICVHVISLHQLMRDLKVSSSQIFSLTSVRLGWMFLHQYFTGFFHAELLSHSSTLGVRSLAEAVSFHLIVFASGLWGHAYMPFGSVYASVGGLTFDPVHVWVGCRCQLGIKAW